MAPTHLLTMLSKPKLEFVYHKCILSLNGELSDKNAIVWVTVDEMRDRLICGGVTPVLSKELLELSLLRGNAVGNFLLRRVYKNISYYRPSSFQDAAGTPHDQRRRPSGQRVRNVPISPPRDYFLGGDVQPATNTKVSYLNNALMEYDTTLMECEKQLANGEDETIPIVPPACDGWDCEGHDDCGMFDISIIDLDETVERETGEEESPVVRVAGDGTDGNRHDACGLFDTSPNDQDEMVERGTLEDETPTLPLASNGNDCEDNLAYTIICEIELIDLDDTVDRETGEEDTPSSPFVHDEVDCESHDANPVIETPPQDQDDPLFETPPQETGKEDTPILPLACNVRDCEGHDTNGIFNFSMLTEFIHDTNTHLAECGCAMDILVFDNHEGAHICELWQCPRCRKCMELHSSRMIKKPVLGTGKKGFKITTIY